jgi:tartrate/fumarate subfamily iron-sulfur-dependent hydro-lyase beta chain
MAEYHLTVPLQDEEVTRLELGDIVYFSGKAWTCRSRLQKYVFDEGNKLPFSTADKNLLIHVGPIMIQDQERWKAVSFQPTSSIRFEKWGTRSIQQWGLKAIVGKTTMGKATAEAMKRYHCIHATPLGVTPNLFIKQLEVSGVHLMKELGSIEAAWQLELNRLGPFLVDMDCRGRNHFDELDVRIAENRKKVYANLKIPEDFEYTKLY